MKIYEYSKFWRILIYVFSPIMLIIFISTLIVPFVPELGKGIPTNAYWLIIPTSIIMIVITILGVLELHIAKFYIGRNAILYHSVFKNQELKLSEIAGYRFREKITIIESKSDVKKKIVINTYFSGYEEITNWLITNYVDLDDVQFEKENSEISNNELFGWRKEERERKIKNAQLVCKIVNWTGIIFGCTVLIDDIFQYSMHISILFPFILILISKYYNNIIVFEFRTKSAYPSFFWSTLTVGIFLGLKSLIKYNILEYSNVITYSGILIIILSASFVIGNTTLNIKNNETKISIVFLLFAMFWYGYGTIVFLNCFYDNQIPIKYHPKILKKEIIQLEHSDSHNITLTPWGNLKEPETIDVTEEFYFRHNENDSIPVFSRKGFLNIDWVEIPQ